MASHPKPKILLLSLKKQPFFDQMYSGLLSALVSRADVREATAGLPQISPSQYSAIFVTDEAISERKYAEVHSRLVDYARAGGVVVIGGLFSSCVVLGDFDAHFLAWGLSWKKAGYRRSTCALNPATHPGFRSNKGLPISYSMKVLSLKGAALGDIMYKRTDDDETNEGAVTYTRVGDGYLGYIGDVNAEEESTTVILAMCGLPT
ncbi:hypothetical protein JB92DRAFT_3004887 [Gautieria morchelliformis]|nr:hypothetical protein JB92DRAFT_3004887 [Gautieria morchelliformis]